MSQLNWAKLLPELAYLQQPAEKYGAIQFESAIDEFLDAASEAEMNELASLAERIRLSGDIDAINRWIDDFPLTEHQEAAHVYFLLLVLDLAGLNFGG